MHEGKFVVAIGGEHSITPALVRAAGEIHRPIGVVQFDAHADLRESYEGTPHSHACTMRRILEAGVGTVAVGIRNSAPVVFAGSTGNATSGDPVVLGANATDVDDDQLTYLWTQEGWIYLAVVIDLYARKVVGWALGKRLTSTLVCDALQMALWRRRPSNGQLVHHSDRGVQYASKAFRKLLRQHGIAGSMSRKGDCWDNAVVESFFGSLKCERVLWRSYQTREEARADIVEYITMFYNSHRLHSYLGYQSPDEFERNGRVANAA